MTHYPDFRLTAVTDPAKIAARLRVECVPASALHAADGRHDALVTANVRSEKGFVKEISPDSDKRDPASEQAERLALFQSLTAEFFAVECGNGLLWASPVVGSPNFKAGFWGSSVRGFDPLPGTEGLYRLAEALSLRHSVYLSVRGLKLRKAVPKPPYWLIDAYYRFTAARTAMDVPHGPNGPHGHGGTGAADRRRPTPASALGLGLGLPNGPAAESQIVCGQEAHRTAAGLLEARSRGEGRPEPPATSRPPSLSADMVLRLRLAALEAETVRLEAHRDRRLRALENRRSKARTIAESADTVRGPEPATVLELLYGAARDRDFVSAPRAAESGAEAWTLSGGRAFLISGPNWAETGGLIGGRGNGRAGGGALSLVMRLSGHVSVRGALAEIRGAFGEQAAARTLAFHKVAGVSATLRKALARPPLPPDACESLWPEARDYLTTEFGVSGIMCDLYHGRGLLAADRRGSVLFVCEGGRGAFRMSVPADGGRGRARPPRASAPPFLLEGTDPLAIVTDCPAGALLLKAREIGSTVLVLGELSDPGRLLPHLKGRAVTVEGELGSRGLKRVRKFLKRERLNHTVKPSPRAG